jgi:hypothetical protein
MWLVTVPILRDVLLGKPSRKSPMPSPVILPLKVNVPLKFELVGC